MAVSAPDMTKSFKEQPRDVLLAMLIWGEARGECLAAKYGVGRVVANRLQARAFGHTLQDVCLRPFQFSCFLTMDPNCRKVMEPLKYDKPQIWEQCLLVARDILRVVDGQETKEDPVPDPVPGATHYYDISMDQAGQPPKWAKSPRMHFVREIGRLKFFAWRA